MPWPPISQRARTAFGSAGSTPTMPETPRRTSATAPHLADAGCSGNRRHELCCARAHSTRIASPDTYATRPPIAGRAGERPCPAWRADTMAATDDKMTSRERSPSASLGGASGRQRMIHVIAPQGWCSTGLSAEAPPSASTLAGSRTPSSRSATWPPSDGEATPGHLGGG